MNESHPPSPSPLLARLLVLGAVTAAAIYIKIRVKGARIKTAASTNVDELAVEARVRPDFSGWHCGMDSE